VSADPRLRLVNAAAGELAGQMLATLDTTEIVIMLPGDLPGPARVAAAALAAMTARLFGRVTVRCPQQAGTALPPNWWGAPDINTVIAAAHALLAATEHVTTTTALTVSVGLIDGDVDFGVGGGDYTAVLDRHPVPVEAGTHHLGLHAGAALVVSQLLGKALGESGPRIVELTQRYDLDLVSHTPIDADSARTEARTVAAHSLLREVVLAGAGSVGSSVAALAATALAPLFAGSAAPSVTFTVVDLDRFDPTRNPFRYPALVGGEEEAKATMIAARLRAAGLDADAVVDTVGAWVARRPAPGVDGLVISSVDTVEGRLEVADIIARQTLSIGVKALELHAQREQMDGATPCPFCHYVDAAPALTQADVYVQMTGIDQNRIFELLTGDKLTAVDVATVAAGGKMGGHGAELVGRRVEDLIGRIYADAPVLGPDGSTAMTIAFPHVSWFAGVLGAVELIKQLRGLPTLLGRVDVDLAGLPPGAVRIMPPDDSGRCLCHSGVRRRAWTRLYGHGQPTVAEETL